MAGLGKEDTTNTNKKSQFSPAIHTEMAASTKDHATGRKVEAAEAYRRRVEEFLQRNFRTIQKSARGLL